MEQEPHHEAGLSADDAIAAAERTINDALDHGASCRRDEQFNHDLGLAAMRHAVELGCAASQMKGQSHTGAEADSTMPSPEHTSSVPDGEVVTKHASERPDSDRQPLANVYADSKRHTVALLLDDVTANMVMYAVRVLAADSEAHAREVRLVGAAMPPDSYGAANRHAIASRHERIASRLRALENSYRDEITTARESPRYVRR